MATVLCLYQPHSRYCNYEPCQRCAASRRTNDRAVGEQECAFNLLKAVEETNGGRCWSYLEAVVETSDPWLLTTQGDPLWLWPRLSQKPPGLWNHANELIGNRKEELAKMAAEIDHKRS